MKEDISSILANQNQANQSKNTEIGEKSGNNTAPEIFLGAQSPLNFGIPSSHLAYYFLMCFSRLGQNGLKSPGVIGWFQNARQCR